MSSSQPSPKVAALIVAAGRGLRIGGDIPKQYRLLAGVPVLVRTVEAFRAHPRVARVVVAIHPDDRELFNQCFKGKAPETTAGGDTRQDSVRRGLEALAADAPDVVLIHDAARPFVDAGLIDRVVDALAKAGAVIPALPVSDTIKRVESGVVTGTVPREALFGAQTPQGFRFGPLLAAHRAAEGQALTDDAAVAEAAGLAVHVVAGSADNVKITEPQDFVRAEARLAGGALAFEFRVGSGYDVHRFALGDHVMLCGVKVPHTSGLEGHSDADAGLHALTDALLGAIGAGDIGQHFPPSDPKWKGASSDRFLRHAMNLVEAAGGTLINADITIICERPKVGPHRAAMVARLAEILSVAPSRLSVKATTTEELGFTGRREGLAAEAVVSVRLPAS